MQELFTTIVDKYVPEFSSQVQLKLPKLNKVQKNQDDTQELPKLKKIKV